MDKWEEKENVLRMLLRRSLHLQAGLRLTQPKTAFISPAALTAIMDATFMKEMEDIGHQADTPGLKPMVNGAVYPVTKETITNYKTLISNPITRKIRLKAMAKELRRLAQGRGDTKGTSTIQFMSHKEIANIPKGKVVTYTRTVIDFRPQKEDPNHMRITGGGNLINYPHKFTTQMDGLTTTKIMWNSTVFTRGARYAASDAKNFYLATPSMTQNTCGYWRA